MYSIVSKLPTPYPFVHGFQIYFVNIGPLIVSVLIFCYSYYINTKHIYVENLVEPTGIYVAMDTRYLLVSPTAELSDEDF